MTDEKNIAALRQETMYTSATLREKKAYPEISIDRGQDHIELQPKYQI